MQFSKAKQQTIHLYTICWNEEFILPYFFKHYDSIVDKYIFFDDGSTDSTLSILNNHPKVEVRSLPRLETDSFVLAEKEVSNTCWKESRGKADWVIVTDVDEFLYKSDLLSYLARCTKKGITAIPTLGYQMISEEVPIENNNLIELVKRGAPFKDMNKLSIFNPDKLTESGYRLGRHGSDPAGTVVYPVKDELLNLHYKYLGFERTFRRHSKLHEKLGTVDKENRWGNQYGWAREKFTEVWNNFTNNSVKDIFAWYYFPSKQHSSVSKRWWRANQAGK